MGQAGRKGKTRRHDNERTITPRRTRRERADSRTEWRPYETSRRDEQARRHEPTGDKTDDMTQRNAQERDATTRRHDETTNETPRWNAHMEKGNEGKGGAGNGAGNE